MHFIINKEFISCIASEVEKNVSRHIICIFFIAKIAQFRSEQQQQQKKKDDHDEKREKQQKKNDDQHDEKKEKQQKKNDDHDEKKKKLTQKIISTTSGYVKGHSAYNATIGHNVKLVVREDCASVIRIIHESSHNWVARFDKGYYNTIPQYDHVNVNTKYSQKGVDPHYRLPSGGLKFAAKTAKVLKFINEANRIALPVSIIYDIYRTSHAIKIDRKYGSTRNTAETLSEISGGYVGAYGGASAGAAVGTTVYPGLGTLIGGIIGGISGGISGALGLRYLADICGNIFKYNIDVIVCKKCKKQFLVRRYQGEIGEDYCEKCRNDL